jgi:signal transduction histidine kinase
MMIEERNSDIPSPNESAAVAAACQSALREERARLSQELHDTLLQDLNFIVLGVEWAKYSIQDGSPGTRSP